MRTRAARGAAVAVLLTAIGCGGGSEFSAASDDGVGDGAPHVDAASDAPPAEGGADAFGGDSDAGPSDATGADASDDDAGQADAAEASSDAPAEIGTGDAADGPADDGCAVVTWFRDDDGDGVGGTHTVDACAPPLTGEWTSKGGDCDDGNPDVNPGQKGWFDHPYVVSGSVQLSYDYDCDGKESEPPGSPDKSTGSCTYQLTKCIGAGYLPVNPPRSGPGVDPFCGSTSVLVCTVAALSCSASTTSGAAVLCR
jgi:hypothetical protein